MQINLVKMTSMVYDLLVMPTYSPTAQVRLEFCLVCENDLAGTILKAVHLWETNFNEQHPLCHL